VTSPSRRSRGCQASCRTCGCATLGQPLWHQTTLRFRLPQPKPPRPRSWWDSDRRDPQGTSDISEGSLCRACKDRRGGARYRGEVGTRATQTAIANQ
jgi:hypothetical protein